MITKTYHIITIDITQIIDSILNPNFFPPFLSNYIELDKMDQIRKWTEMDIIDQIGLNRTNVDQSGLDRSKWIKWTKLDLNRPNWTKVNPMDQSRLN